MDLLFSLLLLVLFAYPLHVHLKSLSRDHNLIDDKLYVLLRKNMILSVLITTATFVNLVASVYVILAR